jgi:hypothetical protein
MMQYEMLQMNFHRSLKMRFEFEVLFAETLIRYLDLLSSPYLLVPL